MCEAGEYYPSWTDLVADLGGCTHVLGNVLTPPTSTVDELDRLVAVEGDLWISGVGLTSVVGLRNLQSVSGKLIVEGASVTNIDGLDALRKVGGLLLEGNAFTHLSGFLRLETISRSGLAIGGNETLTNIDGFCVLRAIQGGVRVRANPALGSIDGFKHLAWVVGDLEIEQNNVVDLSGLAGLRLVDGSLHVAQEPRLTSLDVWRSVPPSIGATIERCPSLAACHLSDLEKHWREIGFGGVFVARDNLADECSP